MSGCPLQGGEALNFGQSCSLGIGGKGLIVISCLGQKVFYMSGKVPCPKRRIFENPTGGRVGQGFLGSGVIEPPAGNHTIVVLCNGDGECHRRPLKLQYAQILEHRREHLCEIIRLLTARETQQDT